MSPVLVIPVPLKIQVRFIENISDTKSVAKVVANLSVKFNLSPILKICESFVSSRYVLLVHQPMSKILHHNIESY